MPRTADVPGPEHSSLSERHRAFVPLIGILETVEGSVGGKPSKDVSREAAILHGELAHHLLPHAAGEGRAVFPVVRRIAGSSAQTLEMTAEHREIGRLTDELDRLQHELLGRCDDPTQERALRGVLQDLRSVLNEHLQHEEAVFVDVLEANLSPQEMEELFRAMEVATEELRLACGHVPGEGKGYE